MCICYLWTRTWLKKPGNIANLGFFYFLFCRSDLKLNGFFCCMVKPRRPARNKNIYIRDNLRFEALNFIISYFCKWLGLPFPCNFMKLGMVFFLRTIKQLQHKLERNKDSSARSSR
ncbi:unnamed protein product [Lactuca virosa]|uniref:Uncharacterized protein n=1 Tax=Lactuca virosa TaxID=75947 RepID=A0AAU9NBE8_9ASTR|nr:unnamed protein product [Lactuca virosa]